MRDSGKPRLSSSSTLTVRVIEESLHRPVALPLEVIIVTMEDEFPGGVIGQLHATDADPYDALGYGHAAPLQRSLFKISPHDGKIIALGGLDAGSYSLNASVSDGRFAVPVPVSVRVEQASAEMLREAVTVRFESARPHDFVATQLKSVLRVLQQAAASQKQDRLHVLSLQPVGGTQQLDLLVAVEMAPPEGAAGAGAGGASFYKAAYLTQKLSASRRQLEEVLRVSAILDKNCSGLECRGAQCEQSIVLDSHDLATYSTPRLSFVSPRFHRTTRCTCIGEQDTRTSTHLCTVKKIKVQKTQIIKATRCMQIFEFSQLLTAIYEHQHICLGIYSASHLFVFTLCTQAPSYLCSSNSQFELCS